MSLTNPAPAFPASLFPASPVPARHAEPSMIFSADDEVGRPSKRLLETAFAAMQIAPTLDLSEVSARMPGPPYYPEIWPGEHYKLLGGLVQLLQPKVVIEIGTSTGLSALTMKKFLPSGGKLLTFDLTPWDQFRDTCFKKSDFEDGALVQYVADLAKPWNTKLFAEMIQPSTLIFIDAAKDGKSEQDFIDAFRGIDFPEPPLVIFDDIRLWNMLAIWRGISAPKLDLTSFGHWSGTGIVDWVWKPNSLIEITVR